MNNRADGHCYNSLELWATSTFFLGSAFSLPIFYVKQANKETLSITSLNFFAKYTIEFRFFIYATFKMPLQTLPIVMVRIF